MQIKKTKEQYYTKLDQAECQRRLRNVLGKTVLQSDFWNTKWENRVIREKSETLFRASYRRINQKGNSTYFEIATAHCTCELKETAKGSMVEIHWKERMPIVVQRLVLNVLCFLYFKTSPGPVIWFDYIMDTILVICLLYYNYSGIRFLIKPGQREPAKVLKSYLCELLELEPVETPQE